MPYLFTNNTIAMQKAATTVVIHLPNIAEFCKQCNGRAYLLETCEIGQHFKNWYLYITGYDNWGEPLMLTLHVGETLVSDTHAAIDMKERSTHMRAKAEQILLDKEITYLKGFLGTINDKIIGEL